MELVAATGADPAGHALAAKLEGLALRHPQLTFRRDAPAHEKDWNDALRRIAREGCVTRALGPERA
jgi:hypothetical protein